MRKSYFYNTLLELSGQLFNIGIKGLRLKLKFSHTPFTNPSRNYLPLADPNQIIKIETGDEKSWNQAPGV